MNKTIYNKDIKYGNENENNIHNILEDKFGKLYNTKDNPNMGKYFEFDKYNDKYFIEIKNRRINHNKHNTLFFGKNKYDKGEELLQQNKDLKIFYIWNCLDGIWCWQHNSSEYKICERGRCDRGIREFDICIDINIQYIKLIKDINL